MPRMEVDSEEAVCAWLEQPQPAVFQGQDLTPSGDAVARCPLQGCSFLGCRLTAGLAAAAARAGCLVMPQVPGLPFDPFRPKLYSPQALFEGFDAGDPASFARCRDQQVYRWYMDPQTRKPLPADADTILMRRLHDAAISDALDDLLRRPETDDGRKVVAIMGGHDCPRDDPAYLSVARLALSLAQAGFVVVTGGGPGLMEAANLGAYAAGFADPVGVVERTVAAMGGAVALSDPSWLSHAYVAWRSLGAPQDLGRSLNVGIPTWFYGHEPPNVFATHIAKYFENSVREEGMLSAALGGVIFAAGNGGTVQEVFQDACQNCYRTYDGVKSPMVLLGVDYWDPRPAAAPPAPFADRRKPVWPLLLKLAQEKRFEDYLLLSDDPAEIVRFIREHPPRP